MEENYANNSNKTSMVPTDEATTAAFNTMFSSIPVQALLSLDQDKTLLPLYADFLTSSNPFAYPYNLNNTSESTQSSNFLSANNPSSAFHHMPLLESHESSSSSSTHNKRPRVANELQPLESVIQSYYHHFPPTEGLSLPSGPVPAMAVLPKPKGKPKMSDKTHALQKLMPCDRKMDIATMLEEAYKYVKYLQAQVKALQSMPCVSSFSCEVDRGVFGGLGRLNRQQLLKVILNSPAAQMRLYSQGRCVFSIEQLVFLKRINEMKIEAHQQQQYQMVVYDPSKLT